MIVPTCPKKLFAQGPRKKYVDIVTDTLHASSSLKPEGKSLMTSGVATATSTEEVTSNKGAADKATVDGSSDTVPEAPAYRRKARNAAETKQFLRQMHHRTPAWKRKLCTDALHASPVDLVRIA